MDEDLAYEDATKLLEVSKKQPWCIGSTQWTISRLLVTDLLSSYTNFQGFVISLVFTLIVYKNINISPNQM